MSAEMDRAETGILDIAMLRQRAAQARRLAWATTDDRLQAALEKVVNELEEAADNAEMAAWRSDRTVRLGPHLPSWDDSR